MIIALNNKCNLTKTEFLKYQEQLQKIKSQEKLILCPTDIFLNFATIPEIDLGAQNVSATTCGAYTGEVSASQLKSMNVKYCIVGHSERRNYQKETDQEINKKIKMLLNEKIIPILCIGEEKKDREANRQNEVIQKELEEDLQGLSEEEKKQIIIAYEPIWAIGTGLIPTNKEITEIMNLIKHYHPHTKVLYGGSANEKNIEELKQIAEIDGYLLGGLSLKPEQLAIFLDKLKKPTN